MPSTLIEPAHTPQHGATRRRSVAGFCDFVNLNSKSQESLEITNKIVLLDRSSIQRNPKMGLYKPVMKLKPRV